MSGFRVCEVPKVNVFAVDPDASAPLVFFGFKVDPLEAACVALRSATVSNVFATSGLAKVGKRVVQSVAINVIDLAIWPIAIYVEPDNAVCLVHPVIDAHFDVLGTVAMR